MSLADHPDDIFAEIVAGVELEEPTDAVDFTRLSDTELSLAHHRIRSELHMMDEMKNLNAVGRAGDLHSQFAAVNAEMRRRWPRKE